MTAELRTPHDRFFKDVWSRKDVGQDFLRHYLPTEVVDLLDLRSLEKAAFHRRGCFFLKSMTSCPESCCQLSGEWLQVVVCA